MKKLAGIVVLCLLLCSCQETGKKDNLPLCISGIYPHLAHYNNEDECGTGAVVPWAGKLWVITYGPHLPDGSSDKLYEISHELKEVTREESIGGTPANRMIHRESNQLFIGPYAIDQEGNVRAIPYGEMPGRHTGNARHLTDPADKIYYATMEEGFYEVDVHTLAVTTLFPDGNALQKEGDMSQAAPLLPGAHGKGLYSGQGVLVYSNNGEAVPEALHDFTIESGALMEWDGSEWKLIRRNQFVEVTGPGGIYGNPNPETDPVWATGWDHRSLLFGIRDHGKWSFYRLPKASHSYDGAHGWNTEWPRIRDIGSEDAADYLMTMHGMFWRFPGSFSAASTAGIRPRSAYLKVIGDFARWGDRLVFGCDDSAKKEFLNKRKVKGDIEGPGQSNSNLWFTTVNKPDHLGPVTAAGAIWLKDTVIAGIPSEPFLFTGWDYRSAWLMNHGEKQVELALEVDKSGNGLWIPLLTESLKTGESRRIEFSDEQRAEWVRVTTNKDAIITVHFTYADKDNRSDQADKMFNGLALAGEDEICGGLLYGLGNNRRAMGISARYEGEDAGYYELDGELNLVPKEDPEIKKLIDERFAIPEDVVLIDESSVLVIDDQDRRWRLPLGDSEFTGLVKNNRLRLCREVATERDLFNCHGTFYELPAENADGFARIRPVASHHFRIHDYASYRGLLVMTGVDPGLSAGNPHIIVSADKKAAVWAGAIDDLWSLGKPTGKGGPWKDTEIKSGVPSDPYLIGYYDKKELALSHDLQEQVTFLVEMEPVGHGDWMKYMQISVPAGETFRHTFPENFHARWIRFTSDKDCTATAWLVYK